MASEPDGMASSSSRVAVKSFAAPEWFVRDFPEQAFGW